MSETTTPVANVATAVTELENVNQEITKTSIGWVSWQPITHESITKTFEALETAFEKSVKEWMTATEAHVKSTAKPATTSRSRIVKKVDIVADFASISDPLSSPTKDYMVITEDQWIKFCVNTSTFEPFIIHDGKKYDATKDSIDTIKESLRSVKKLKTITASTPIWADQYTMGDTVLIYWPTGTGKTHSILQWIRDQKISHAMITVSDGFEDIDMLTYILPSPKGIVYKEKDIVSIFRKAAAGEKVAILIDEVNRGSRSFMNMLLKLLDPVTWQYEVNNFVADEIIKINKENIIFFCTANLWGWYSGTNEIDEALFDRFNKIQYMDYNRAYEAELFSNFWPFASHVEKIVSYIRDLYKDNSLKRPVSSRTIKAWAECFVNSPMDDKALVGTFNQSVMYRLVGIDAYGNPNEQDVWVITSKFIELGIIK